MTIIGLGEDGAQGLSTAVREALEQAEVVIGPPRHLALLPALTAQCLEWPVPFADGIARLMEHHGRQVVMLASGDPFWFGAGAIVARHLDPGEWVAHPAPSTFAWAASRLGWALQVVVALGAFLVPAIALVALIFGGMWAYATIKGASLDRRNARLAAEADDANGD